MLDTPTNNFAVLNPLNVFFGTPSLSEGNLKTTTTVNAFSTILNNNGKWYFEVLKTDTTSGSFGIDSRSSGGSQYYLYDNDGLKNSPSTGAVSYGATFTTNDVISVAFDLDLGSVEFYKNGVSQGVAFSGIPEEIYAIQIAFPSVANFGADSSFAGLKTRQGNTDANGIGDFYYEPPAGYLALCTDNTGGDPIADIT
jgi:hypothetical protein